MLTPAFELKQDDGYLTIIIKAPFAKVSETEIFIEDDNFKFYSKPYFLRLTLPGNLVEDGRETADYDVDKGTFTVRVPKQNPGEVFEGLDMLTTLLAPRRQKGAAAPLIEVIDNKEQVSTVERTEDSTEGGEAVTDWSCPQVPYQEEDTPLKSARYGFANQKSGVFQRLQSELCDIVDVADPDTSNEAERREQRIADEQQKFDEDHYLADLYEDECVQQVLGFTPDWLEEVAAVQRGTPVDMAVALTADNKEKMRKLPRKEYLLTQAEESIVFLGMLDIILAYCYNHRMTEGENNVESGWTISKLSATLSWLETFHSIDDVVRTSFRRCLCYPLYRHWQLNQQILQDATTIFSLGRRKLLHCLLEVHTLLTDTDARYVLNDLYVTDYCVWVQSVSEKKIKSFSDALDQVHVSKADVGFDLDEVERISRLALENADLDETTSRLDKVSLTGCAGPDSDDDSSSDEDTDSDGTDTDSDQSSSNCEGCSSESDKEQVADVDGSAKDSDNSHKKCLIEILSSSQEDTSRLTDNGSQQSGLKELNSDTKELLSTTDTKEECK